MKSTDIFDIFEYDLSEINYLRDKAYFKSENGDYILQSDIKARGDMIFQTSKNSHISRSCDENGSGMEHLVKTKLGT
jgi:hypothetical protein